MSEPEIRSMLAYDEMSVDEMCRPLSARIIPLRNCLTTSSNAMSVEKAEDTQRKKGIKPTNRRGNWKG